MRKDADSAPLLKRPTTRAETGLKLEAVLEKFTATVKNKIAREGSASTGGFADCLLQHGAIKVFAVDAGYGQIESRSERIPRSDSTELAEVLLRG